MKSSSTWANGVAQTIHTTKADTISGAVQDPDGQRNGLRLEGTNGWLWVNRGSLKASDEDLIKTPLPDSAERLYKSDDHMANFFECVRSRKPPICEAEVGPPLGKYLPPRRNRPAHGRKAHLGSKTGKVHARPRESSKRVCDPRNAQALRLQLYLNQGSPT